MSFDLRDVYKPNHHVVYINDDFDAVRNEVPCIVLEVFKDKMTILDIETDTKLYIERGFNLSNVKPLMNTDVFQSAINKMIAD